jgi:hypothetical protein
MVLYEKKDSESVILGIFIIVLLFFSWMLLGVEILDSRSSALAILISNNNTYTESTNTNTTNKTLSSSTNGSISIITPQELQDRRHSPS